MTSPAAPPAQGGERFLLFSLGEVRFAVEGRVVRGVVPIESMTPVPRAPGALRGVFQHRGDVVPLLDVRTALGVDEVPLGTPVLTLLLEVPPWSVGVAIDEVKGYERIPGGESETPPGDRPRPFSKSAIERNGERFAVLDAEALLGALRVA